MDPSSAVASRLVVKIDFVDPHWLIYVVGRYQPSPYSNQFSLISVSFQETHLIFMLPQFVSVS